MKTALSIWQEKLSLSVWCMYNVKRLCLKVQPFIKSKIKIMLFHHFFLILANNYRQPLKTTPKFTLSEKYTIFWRYNRIISHKLQYYRCFSATFSSTGRTYPLGWLRAFQKFVPHEVVNKIQQPNVEPCVGQTYRADIYAVQLPCHLTKNVLYSAAYL